MAKIKLAALALLLTAGFSLTRAQSLPLELRQLEAPNNFQSGRGVPLSTTNGVPRGSDGRLASSSTQGQEGLPTGAPNTNQFQSFISFGGAVVPATPLSLVSNQSFADIAVNAGLPLMRSNNQVSIVLRRAQVGSPYISKQVSFLFGSVIPVPDRDDAGNAFPANVRAEDYWRAQPLDIQNPTYYWSPHALKVFAIQAGPIDITWIKAAPTSVGAPPGDFTADKYLQESGAYYLKKLQRYVVSGSAAKQPKRMFWTEGNFRATGKPVTVPAARVGGVNVVYNNNFVERVAHEYLSPGQVPIVTTNRLEETRTLWYDQQQGQIFAFNVEGRVFLELLGDLKPSGVTREHLGFEIVDVYKQPNPTLVVTELGDPLTPLQGTLDDGELFPEPVLQVAAQSFTYRHTSGGNARPTYFAIRETRNINDYLIHWLEEGEVGLRWPSLLVRYRLVWPNESSRYSHYVRPPAANEEEAKLTAVALPTENVPRIEYQDVFDFERAKLTETFKFYSFLDNAVPFHRALLRYSSGGDIAFERVFSWLDTRLKHNSSNDFLGTIVTNLTAWNAGTRTLRFTNQFSGPRVFTNTVAVGVRIPAPPSELGAGAAEDYWAGHIRLEPGKGNSFSISAYQDPFVVGFDTARLGAIIPVNVIPSHNDLEVWWFRKNSSDLTSGFRPIYWPSVIANYLIVWPSNPKEIILASNAGSGGLASLEAKGALYYQNNRALAGYNPNEEHALMIAGQAYALRDDLNIVSGEGFTSLPYVLLQYTAGDGRPSMTPFKVLREKPSEGIIFDYSLNAGTILQPPMPLAVMDKPTAKVPGQAPRSLNRELGFWRVSSSQSSLTSFRIFTTNNQYFQKGMALALQDDSVAPAITRWLYVTNSFYGTNRLDGFISLRRPLNLAYSGPSNLFNSRLTFTANTVDNLQVGAAVVLFTPTANFTATVNAFNADALTVVLDFPAARQSSDLLTADLVASPISGGAPNAYNNWRLATEPVPEITSLERAQFYSKFTFQDRKANLWIYRGPHALADWPMMQMQYYYKTKPGFYFPSAPFNAQPPVDTITPFLRPLIGVETYAGDPIYGDANKDAVGDGNALPIVYRPVWPASAPVLQMAESLTLPKRGLPAIRGQTSMQILYQQSETAPAEEPSVVLHDPTREKEFFLGEPDATDKLNALPDSLNTSIYLGKTYFPNLPPHLSGRFFYDPNRGTNGALVLRGKFMDEALGDDYLLLNVLSAKDIRVLKSLCIGTDARINDWKSAIDHLSTRVDVFMENLERPGTFIADPDNHTQAGPGELSEINDSDAAVDSYALTAIGPSSGYVTLMAGNGRAFTPAAEPTSLHIIKVADQLYRGELKVVPTDNPLSEKLTMQQVVDLAGKTEKYVFQWKIAPPIDGKPPAVYANSGTNLLGDAIWTHVRHPLPTDSPGSITRTVAQRRVAEVTDRVVPVQAIDFASVSLIDNIARVVLNSGATHTLANGNKILFVDGKDAQQIGTVSGLATTPTLVAAVVNLDENTGLDWSDIREVKEPVLDDVPQSIVYRSISVPKSSYSDLWLSLDLEAFMGTKVYFDGVLVVRANFGTNDTVSALPPTLIHPLPRAYRLPVDLLNSGQRGANAATHTIAVEFTSSARAGTAARFNLHLDAIKGNDLAVIPNSQWNNVAADKFEDGVRAVFGESADVQALSDNYIIMRYRQQSDVNSWSDWTVPQLAEGWIKRVLAGINPYNQRINDLFNNRVNTDVSLLTQAGKRWEGDVALNLANINDFGLIEIYETVLRRGKMLSIGAGINYGPANDALLLAVGYLNDLYMIEGNEAWADALNPTIGIGTKDAALGDIATALFSFKGQVPSLIEEELALLRGRDDFLQPGVEVSPIYNRLVWNYTRGIDAGEVVYALNYNIQEDNDQGVDGVINADDARKMFPQGHGDAYGHYLTATKGYYSLLLDSHFDWVPRTEAVLVLGKPVQVDYLDERKFAAAAAALMRAGRQVFDLTWRADYQPGQTVGWEHFAKSRYNATPPARTRLWGLDHWASRAAQGGYMNWVVGNSLLPETDPDPEHEGIQKIDRATVPELTELAAAGHDLQVAMDNADTKQTPLGLSQDSLAFDINPNKVVGADPQTHFEQIYDRARIALNNALAAFDDAKDVTRFLRAEQDSLADFKAKIDEQELAYTHKLIELYGTPYTDDIGPGKTYATGFSGPDLLHYAYVDTAELNYPGLFNPADGITARFDTQLFPADWADKLKTDWDAVIPARTGTNDTRVNGRDFVEFSIKPAGFSKPPTWTGRRASPGKLQQAASEIMVARNKAASAWGDADGQKAVVDKAIQMFAYRKTVHEDIRDAEKQRLIAEEIQKAAEFASDVTEKSIEILKTIDTLAADTLKDLLPDVLIVGLANGGDMTFGARAALQGAKAATIGGLDVADYVRFFAIKGLTFGTETANLWLDFNQIAPREWDAETRQQIIDIGDQFSTLQGLIFPMNTALQQLDDAQRRYRSLTAEGDRIQEERQVFRRRAAAVIQGYRTRDAGFRVFRNEKLERYKTLFDLAAQYTFLAANAYDYETGLLHTDKGRAFINRIVSARALGVVRNGEPQYAGSNTGDPGLSSVLAEMKADWLVVKGRLGFNNPDAYGTTVSLRAESERILPGTEGNNNWKDVLQRARKANLLDDADVRRYCMQLDNANGLPVPGLVIEFSTTIADGENLFGRQLAAGDHNYNSSAFATKIFGVGVALDGYIGMDTPGVNGSVVAGAGSSSPSDPSVTFLDPRALAATPYVYLVPVGTDSMRTPPLGDASGVRTWNVKDVTVPLPFNIGGSELSSPNYWQSSSSLTEELFGLRKHQAFRPVSTAAVFTPNIFSSSGGLAPSQFTNRRLIGRSVWNSKWKLVIPGRNLMNDPNEGLERFIQSVKDVKLHFVTYSYSGN